MNKTNFTNIDIKNIMETVFNGNLKAFKDSYGEIAYENLNSENIRLVDGEGATEIDLAQYLNIEFYSWKNRVVQKGEFNQEFVSVDAWVESLNGSLNEAFGLVEVYDREIFPSDNIDSATLSGRITFLIQTNKVPNLEYYANKIGNIYRGIPQVIQNSYGYKINAYFNIGMLVYESEPIDLPLGECVTVTLNFNISYLTEALSYFDNPIYLSLDNGYTYHLLPYTKCSIQNIFTGSPITKQNNPTQMGIINSNSCFVATFSFFDFNIALTTQINELFWRLGSFAKNAISTEEQNPNIPVYIKVTNNGNDYFYKTVITDMQKVLANGEFNATTITVKGWGKN